MNDESTARSDVTRLVSGEAAEALRQSDEGRLRASLVVIAGDEIGREYPIDGARALIGRGEAIVLSPSSSVEESRMRIASLELERNGARFGVTISQGLAGWLRHGRTAEALIAAADRALYQAKADGRNCVRIASA